MGMRSESVVLPLYAHVVSREWNRKRRYFLPSGAQPPARVKTQRGGPP